MRRAVAIIGLVLVISGFVTLVLSIALNITFLIPVALIFAAFVLLSFAKRMNADDSIANTDVECDDETCVDMEAEHEDKE